MFEFLWGKSYLAVVIEYEYSILHRNPSDKLILDSKKFHRRLQIKALAGIIVEIRNPTN